MQYLKFISMSFQRSLAYRVEYFTSILNAFLYIFIFTSVWKALLPEGTLMNGLSRNDMIAYAVLSTLIKASMGRNESLISSRVKTGEIAVDLMKPYSLPLMYFSDTLGATLFQMISRSAPLLIFSVLFFDIKLPVDGTILMKFIPVYLLSFCIFFLMLFLISSISFFIVEIFPVWVFFWALITLASGAIIPLDFFPESFANLLKYTPFPYLYYYPTMLLLGKHLPFGYMQLVGNYVIIFITWLTFSNIVYFFGVRRLSIAGG